MVRLGTSAVGGCKCVAAGAAQILLDLKNTAYYAYPTLHNSRHVFRVVRLVVIVICRAILNFKDNQQLLRFVFDFIIIFSFHLNKNNASALSQDLPSTPLSPASLSNVSHEMNTI